MSTKIILGPPGTGKTKTLIDKIESYIGNGISPNEIAFLTYSNQAAEIAKEGITLEYDSGNTRTTLELIQSRSLLLDARIAISRSERDFIVSQYELSKELGS